MHEKEPVTEKNKHILNVTVILDKRIADGEVGITFVHAFPLVPLSLLLGEKTD